MSRLEVPLQHRTLQAPVWPLETLMTRGGRRNTMFKGGACRPHRANRGGPGAFSECTDDNRCVLVWEKQAGEWRIVLDQFPVSGK